MRTYFDWKPVVRSICKTLVENGVEIVGASDCEEPIKSSNIKEIVECICGVDEGYIYVKTPDTPEGKKKVLFIVLGNEPEETIADWSSDPLLDKVCEKFSEKWEGRKCPTVQR